MAKGKSNSQDKIVGNDGKVIIDMTEEVPQITPKKTSEVKKLTDDMLIKVMSNSVGELFYIDPTTGEKTTWRYCGEVLKLPLGKLREMRNKKVKFFENQLIIITGFADITEPGYTASDIYFNLGINQYYENLINPSDYKKICNWTPEEIEDNVSIMSSGAKSRLLVVLNTYVEKGILDSLRSITAFEKALGCDLRRPE